MRRLLVAVIAVCSLVLPFGQASAARWEPHQRCPQWEWLFRKHKLPVRTFSYIAWREARCRPTAQNARWRDGKIIWTLNRNGTYDSGLLQINSSWVTVTSQVCKSKFGDLKVLLDPQCNVAVGAYLYFEGGGLRNWSM